MRRTATKECSQELDLDKFYRVVRKDEKILPSDLIREYRPLEYGLFDRDKQGWYLAEELISGWIGRTMQEFFDFRYNHPERMAQFDGRDEPFVYEYEVLREVKPADVVKKLRKKKVK